MRSGKRVIASQLVALLVPALAVAACGAEQAAGAVSSPSQRSGMPVRSPGEGGGSLEAAAAKAGTTGRTVAMSLIGLALAVSATILAFKRDFKEAAGVFAVGIVAVLLATPTGVSVLRDTVASLFGGP